MSDRTKEYKEISDRDMLFSPEESRVMFLVIRNYCQIDSDMDSAERLLLAKLLDEALVTMEINKAARFEVIK